MPENIISEYIKIIDSIYGVFLDSCQGFSNAKALFERSQLLTVERNKKLMATNHSSGSSHYNVTINELDDSCLIYSRGKKEDSNYRILHYCPTQAEYKKRNSPNGDNYKFIGNMALISIYDYWESSCRNKLASYHKVKQKQITSQILGDIRLLRNSIVHHMGIALSEIKNCRRFKWYQPNDVIFIDEDKMEDIVSAIKSSKSTLYEVKQA